ncbi:SDR family NAD(P)-dependent oxidoreductase [Hyphomicrobiaceae bacterium 22]|uniref:SDR family NAD(P)-dependent oxidoreductase n=2 Tax=Prosthecodimorpha staleyi TaxID=2840188 RepID=A0A947GJX1_9HYPH|nr:SDR family NAD(P)-dependent oxidoreductase [Prosthecodimorpha staleyi]MBT9292624.1 SDR family NAD(P)-dependent oxidoreductase [Prosthecodimorpha staleyi]
MAAHDKPEGVALVTGASSGIGRALALELARRGRAVVATARRLDLLHSLSAEAEALTGAIRAAAADVTDAAAMRALFPAVEAAHGPIGLVVANAGIYLPVSADRPDPDAYARTIAVNLQGTVNTVLPAIEAMRARGVGRIAIVSSVAGYSGLPTSAAYGATKAALINLAESLKFDLDPIGIRVQLVSPGFVETEATDRNAFPMPFIVPAATAARRIADGLERDAFEITFPRRFTWWLKFGRMLPYSVYFPLVRRLTGASAGPSRTP